MTCSTERMLPVTSPASTRLCDDLLSRLTRALDCLIEAGRPYHGLFPSMLDRRTGRMLTDAPPPIEGQRPWDRAYTGSNLIHDESTLRTMYALADALDRPDFAEAADAYLRRFATHCTNTATGLFPWGEHSFWHLAEDRVGNSYRDDPERSHDQPAIHDHLRQTPLWLWEKLQQFNPNCVERFAEGLDFHWIEGKREEYIRHAYIEQRQYHPRGQRACDFPRHGGFYILDWAFAYAHTGREDFTRQMRDMLDHWWPKRDERGLLLSESRSPTDDADFLGINGPGQTISLATSLLESADLLNDHAGELAATMRQRAATYIDGFFAAPHDLSANVFVISSRRDDNTVSKAMPIWGSRYGLWPASYVALTCLCAYRIIEDDRLLAWAEAVGRAYATQPFSRDSVVPAMDAGLGLGVMADLYAITGEARWQQDALRIAEQLIDIYFDDPPLPRSAAGIDWYESQMGPGFLLHGLARTALLTRDRDTCPLDADYTSR